jgi:tetratricopeptide (TPR) repeat protein
VLTLGLIQSQNVVPWTHLGLLYLQHDDLELANEALLRAQTLDPDHTLAWVGQALVATANKHEADAKALLEHALTLAADVVSAFPKPLARYLVAACRPGVCLAPACAARRRTRLLPGVRAPRILRARALLPAARR